MGGVGAYGKIPALGDFFRLSLPPDFVGVWDAWLQGMMRAGRAQLGPRWQECYLSAPIWRFALAPGLAGRAAMTGVMMASVDRVGREFPLTLAGVPETGEDFAALEEAALDSLDEGATRDTLSAALKGLCAPAIPAPRGISAWSALIGDEVLTMRFTGLPGQVEAARFFDPAPPARVATA
jgi:type VI secretion system protein ImpM